MCIISVVNAFQDLDGMRVGGVSQGELGPFSSVKLDIIWQPTIPGKVEVDFSVSFSDPDSENVSEIDFSIAVFSMQI